jgi:LuxR family maltose regulon positive regulatory protein
MRLTPPPAQAGLVPRPRLTQALTAATDARLIIANAPVGYGKSTLLSQWYQQEDHDRVMAWLELERADSDPAILVSDIVHSIRMHAPGFGATVEPLLDARAGGMPETTAGRLVEELAAVPGGLTLVLDDYHLLRGQRVHQLMTELVTHLPAGTQLVLGTRADPALPLGRLRALGAMTELRAGDLRFDVETTAALMASAGVRIRSEDVATLVERTEGWPGGLYLALLSLRDEPDPTAFVESFAGSHRHIADYLSEQVLRRQSGAMRTFLLRTSVLDRMCGPLCDALLDAGKSHSVLEKLERSNVFVVPLDDSRDWYRYHQLFHQMLRAELARTEPGAVPGLRRRASQWLEDDGQLEPAVQQLLAAHDFECAVEVIGRHWWDLFNSHRIDTVRGWLETMGTEVVAAYPAAALTAGWVSALQGQPEAMERWLRVAEGGSSDGQLPGLSHSLVSGAAAVRGLFGYSGLKARRTDLERAWDLEPVGSAWRPFLLWGLGHVALLSGDAGQAVAHFGRALRLTDPQQTVLTMITLAEMSLAQTKLGRVAAAEIMVRRAEAIAAASGLTSDSRSSGVALARGAVLVAQGRLTAGGHEMERALTLRASPGQLSPWPTLEVLLELAGVRTLLGDRLGARSLLVEAQALLADLPDAGDLPRRLEENERLLDNSGRPLAYGQRLTSGEMAVLRLLPTPKSHSQIGADLFVSVNTVKSHNRAIYRKLGVSSRESAVQRATELDLL